MFKFETMKKSIADAQKKKERKEFLNKVGNAAGTALGYAAIGVLATANALAEADLQASRDSSYNSNDHYNYSGSNYSASTYNSTRNVTKDITMNFMKEFVRSFGSLETRAECNMRSGYMHSNSYNGATFKSYYCNATFRVACSAYDWKLYAGTVNGVVYMVLTGRYDDIIDVASCYSNDLYNKFRAEAIRNYRVNDIHTAVLKALQ